MMVRERRWLMMLGLLGLMVLPGLGQAVKVNKSFIQVYPPNTSQEVVIKGLPGAITNPEGEVQLYAENLYTKERGYLELNGDGSFSGHGFGLPGEKIRVYAVRKRGNRSYGTFTIPEVPVTSEETGDGSVRVKWDADEEEEPMDYQEMRQQRIEAAREKQMARRNGGRENERRRATLSMENITIVTLAIHSETGEVLDSATIRGKTLRPVRGEDDLRGLAARLVEQCLTIAKHQLRDASAIEHDERATDEGEGEAEMSETKSDEAVSAGDAVGDAEDAEQAADEAADAEQK